jgi:hypothetical protein
MDTQTLSYISYIHTSISRPFGLYMDLVPTPPEQKKEKKKENKYHKQAQAAIDGRIQSSQNLYF